MYFCANVNTGCRLVNAAAKDSVGARTLDGTGGVGNFMYFVRTGFSGCYDPLELYALRVVVEAVNPRNVS